MRHDISPGSFLGGEERDFRLYSSNRLVGALFSDPPITNSWLLIVAAEYPCLDVLSLKSRGVEESFSVSNTIVLSILFPPITKI